MLDMSNILKLMKYIAQLLIFFLHFDQCLCVFQYLSYASGSICKLTSMVYENIHPSKFGCVFISIKCILNFIFTNDKHACLCFDHNHSRIEKTYLLL